MFFWGGAKLFVPRSEANPGTLEMHYQILVAYFDFVSFCLRILSHHWTRYLRVFGCWMVLLMHIEVFQDVVFQWDISASLFGIVLIAFIFIIGFGYLCCEWIPPRGDGTGAMRSRETISTLSLIFSTAAKFRITCTLKRLLAFGIHFRNSLLSSVEKLRLKNTNPLVSDFCSMRGRRSSNFRS